MRVSLEIMKFLKNKIGEKNDSKRIGLEHEISPTNSINLENFK
jgi:hypothetical protein